MKLFNVIRELGLRRAGKYSLFALRERIMGQMDRRNEVALGMAIQKWAPLDNLEISSQNKKFAFSYVPSPRLVVNALLRTLPEDLSKFTFIDIGSGEGRMLVVALDFPFRQALGIEFAKELHATAQNNIASASRIRHDGRRCESLLLDATDYELPDGDCIVYFNNPFAETVFAKVLSKIEQAHQKHGKTIYVFYSQPSRGLDDNRTENVALLQATDWLVEHTFRFPSLLDRFLLGSYELHIFRNVRDAVAEETSGAQRVK